MVRMSVLPWWCWVWQAVTGYYHSHCFKCKLCQKPLSQSEYSVDPENQVCLTIIQVSPLSRPPWSTLGLLLGRLLLFVRTEVWEMSQDNLPRGRHQSGHQSQGRAEGWLDRIRNVFFNWRRWTKTSTLIALLVIAVGVSFQRIPTRGLLYKVPMMVFY